MDPHSAKGSPPASLSVGSLRCEYLTDPIGVDSLHPRLSWILFSNQRGATQTAYRVLVASSADRLNQNDGDLWDSGKVRSSEQNQIEYVGKTLASRMRCCWKVQTWDGADRPSQWSDAATWEMGLLERGDWQAKWIAGTPAPATKITVVQALYESEDHKTSADVTRQLRMHFDQGGDELRVENDALGGDPAPNQHKRLIVRYRVNDGPEIEAFCPEHRLLRLPDSAVNVMRREFNASRPIVRARLYASALGLYDLRINGKPVTDQIFSPDWTDYKKRARYGAYDVTALLKPGQNVIGGSVANGWYSGHIANGNFQYWGTQPSLMAQLELTDDDGSIQTIATDERWQAHPGPILASDIMNGEDYDARVELDPSDPSLSDDGQWTSVHTVTEGLPPTLSAGVAPPVRELMTLPAKSVKEVQPGHWLFDLGQNMVGVARLRVDEPAGTRVTIHFAEMLNSDGTIYTDNYRGARSTDSYICRGGGTETWQPRFTYHGFRYVELTGLTQKPTMTSVVGVVLGSDTPSTGEFTCSDPRINQLWSNIRWGQRGNFFSVPTDCPQRDERLGWMGDAQVFIGTAVYNADVASFFSKWLVDVDDEQKPAGEFTSTAPDTVLVDGHTPGWADAGVICPWTIYRAYGDKRVLAEHLPAMMKWVDWCAEHSDHYIRSKDRGSDFGDWLSIKADTSKELLGTAYFAYSADLVARSAAAIGDSANAQKYAQLFDEIAAAFRKKYLAPDGSIIDGTQTAYALALAFHLLPEADRPAAAARLAADVHAKGDHLSTGFLGVSYLLPALSNHGQLPLAYTLLLQDTFPSWLFSVGHGATTIWERWDGWTPENGFQDKSMNSFNHYSLGSCGQWLYETVAGISQPADGAGFAKVLIAPKPDERFRYASAEYDSIRGPIKSGWRLENDRLKLDVTIPANTTATVCVPTADPNAVLESDRPAAQSAGVRSVSQSANLATFEIGSGVYHFEAPVERRE